MGFWKTYLYATAISILIFLGINIVIAFIQIPINNTAVMILCIIGGVLPVIYVITTSVKKISGIKKKILFILISPSVYFVILEIYVVYEFLTWDTWNGEWKF